MNDQIFGKRKHHFAKVAVFAIVAAAVLGEVVMLLWNRVVPPVFGWHSITYFQGLWLLILCKILFGGFHGRHTGNMTPEERQKFREAILKRQAERMGSTGATPGA